MRLTPASAAAYARFETAGVVLAITSFMNDRIVVRYPRGWGGATTSRRSACNTRVFERCEVTQVGQVAVFGDRFPRERTERASVAGAGAIRQPRPMRPRCVGVGYPVRNCRGLRVDEHERPRGRLPVAQRNRVLTAHVDQPDRSIGVNRCVARQEPQGRIRRLTVVERVPEVVPGDELRVRLARSPRSGPERGAAQRSRRPDR